MTAAQCGLEVLRPYGDNLAVIDSEVTAARARRHFNVGRLSREFSATRLDQPNCARRRHARDASDQRLGDAIEPAPEDLANPLHAGHGRLAFCRWSDQNPSLSSRHESTRNGSLSPSRSRTTISERNRRLGSKRTSTITLFALPG